MLEAIILVCMLYSQQEKKSLLEFTIRKITKQNFFFQDLLAFWRGDTNSHPALVVSATAYVLKFRFEEATVTIMCHNDELSWMMSWVDKVLPDK